MTDEQIIEAYERCKSDECDNCPALCNGVCLTPRIDEQILSIVNRQKSEIERLQKENERWKNGFMGACMLENCKLKDVWKSEAIKEFAKYIIDKSQNGIIQISDIPDYVKEMTENK